MIYGELCSFFRNSILELRQFLLQSTYLLYEGLISLITFSYESVSFLFVNFLRASQNVLHFVESIPESRFVFLMRSEAVIQLIDDFLKHLIFLLEVIHHEILLILICLELCCQWKFRLGFLHINILYLLDGSKTSSEIRFRLLRIIFNLVRKPHIGSCVHFPTALCTSTLAHVFLLTVEVVDCLSTRRHQLFICFNRLGDIEHKFRSFIASCDE